ncbi:MAG: hypothetical protein QOG05_5280 [Streptosporangiaceae bacterium]|jgi:hypothetical protein|nr:hypothetical protein [Streptosporangiaceae bacterium]
MLLDLIRALCAAVAAVVLPGYFWAALLRPAGGLAERLGYSSALSLATVPIVALVLARLARSGITLWIAIASVVLVLGSGALAVLWRGAAGGTAEPILPAPRAIQDPRALALLAVAFLAALGSVLRPGQAPAWLGLLILVLLVLAVVVGRDAPREGAGETRPAAPALRGALLAIVLAATAVRAYEPVIRYDWPSIRGLDHFSHVVMAEQMLGHGSYGSYLIYPPGFPTMSAVLARLSGLPPLVLFSVIAPALLVLTALAVYVLATRLWGWRYGIVAAALSGLVLHGAYGSLADGRYPDLTSAYFLITMGIAALLTLYASPSWRSAALAAVLGASPILYHSVATLYEALILVLAVVTSVPYLLYLRRRAEARVVLAGLAALALLAICYGWYTYGVGWPVAGHSASSAAVSLVLGSQPAPGPLHLFSALGPPIVWLGVLGLALLAAMLRYERRPAPVLATVTMILWCLIMYAGSRTAADGFPQRFERDLGAALSVVAALGAGVLVKTAWLAWRRAAVVPAAALSLALAVPAVLAIALPSARQARTESRPARLLSPPVLAAGTWLRQHNSGGTIVSTPMNHGITERSVLALGGYTGLMYYAPGSYANARSLPPAGVTPLIDSQEVLEHPDSCAAAEAISREDVRFVVLYRTPGRDADMEGFRADPGRYHPVFENHSVIIYAPEARACAG